MVRGFFLAMTALLAACTTGSRAEYAKSADHPLLGRRVTFSVPDNSGRTHHVPQSSVRATIIDFWSPTCAPCKDTVPVLAERIPDLEGAGVTVHFMAVLARNASLSQAEQTLSSWGAPGVPFLVDRDGAIQLELELQQLPASVVADSSGTVRWVAPVGASPLDVETAARRVASDN